MKFSVCEWLVVMMIRVLLVEVSLLVMCIVLDSVMVLVSVW